MPKVMKLAAKKSPLLVRTNVWGHRITYLTKGGKRVVARNYQEARDYAAQHGYTGIRVEYQ